MKGNIYIYIINVENMNSQCAPYGWYTIKKLNGVKR